MIIALNGPAGSGKSTLAVELVRLGWHRLAFADPLRAMLGALLTSAGHDQDDVARLLTTPEGKRERPACLRGRTVREALQSLGTAWGRSCIGADVWTAHLVQRVAVARAAGALVVVDDCRFPDEAEAIRDAGGLVLRLVRPGAGLTDAGAGHVSEEPLPSELVDGVVLNGAPPSLVVARLLARAQTLTVARRAELLATVGQP